VKKMRSFSPLLSHFVVTNVKKAIYWTKFQ
jgi:hypothetical protein